MSDIREMAIVFGHVVQHYGENEKFRIAAMDIVERLNADAQGIDLGAEDMGWSPDTDLIRKAATEIERLRAEREALAKEMERAIKLFAINNTLTQQLAAAQEQITLLGLQANNLIEVLESDEQHGEGTNGELDGCEICIAIHELKCALSALPKQVNSEDARDGK